MILKKIYTLLCIKIYHEGSGYMKNTEQASITQPLNLSSKIVNIWVFTANKLFFLNFFQY